MVFSCDIDMIYFFKKDLVIKFIAVSYTHLDVYKRQVQDRSSILSCLLRPFCDAPCSRACPVSFLRIVFLRSGRHESERIRYYLLSRSNPSPCPLLLRYIHQDLKHRRLKPVSYTHLDVYKRQVFTTLYNLEGKGRKYA